MRVDKFSGRPVWRLAKIDQRDRIQSLQKEKPCKRMVRNGHR